MTQQERPSEATTVRTDEETSSNWWNRIRYGFYAPFYDWVAKPFESGRKHAIERVDPQPEDRLLILGCGTGMDLEYLSVNASGTAIDVGEGMVIRTEQGAEKLRIFKRIHEAARVFGHPDVVAKELHVPLVADLTWNPKQLVRELEVYSSIRLTPSSVAIFELFAHQIELSLYVFRHGISVEIDEIIEASLERYGTDPPTDTEILRNLIYRDYDGDTAPESLALDRVMAESIRAVQLRRGEHDQNGWVPVEIVDDEVLSRLESASDSELETSIDELTEVRRESPLVEVDLSVENDAVVVRLSEDGQEISSPATGDVSAAGGNEHDELLFDIEESLTGLGFAVEIVEQDGSERPDGIATHPDLDSEFAIEAETTTPTKPAKVLQNLKRAQSRDQVPLFVVRPDEDERTGEASRIEDILETPVRELADGTERFYTMDERLTFGGGANTRGGVTTVRPRTDGSDRTFWNRTDSEYELTNGDRVFARVDAEGPISKDDLPAHFSYDPETGQYTVYAQGENHTYGTKAAFEEEWVVVKRPFIPSREFPHSAFESDDYHILILPTDGPPLRYEGGDTIPVAADLSALDERTADDQSDDSHAEPGDMTAATRAEGQDETESTETTLDLDPDDDGVAVFVDRHITVNPNASVPKSDLFEAYSTWVDEHGISGTNKVWFARKLSEHVPVEPGRQRVDGQRVTVYEGIALSEKMKSSSSPDNVSE